MVNTATATSGTTTSPPDAATALTAQAPQLHARQDGVAADLRHVGQTITYTYVITNDSDATLNGPFTVTDDKTTVTCPPPASLRPGDVRHLHRDLHDHPGRPRRRQSSPTTPPRHATYAGSPGHLEHATGHGDRGEEARR